MQDIRFTLKKLEGRLHLIEAAVYRERLPLSPFRFHAGSEPVAASDIDDSAWITIRPGQYWGKYRQEFTLRTEFVVPASWNSPVALHLPLGRSKSLEALAFLYGPEGLAFIDGTLLEGVNPNHDELLLPENVLDGKKHILALHGWTGIKDERYEMGQAALVQVDRPLRDFVTLARTILEIIKQGDANRIVYKRLLAALDDAFQMLDLREPWGSAFYGSAREAHESLKAAIGTAGALLEERVAGVGHAHIDVAWLWTLAQTRKKATGTFSTALRLLERYPDLRFTQSQPQLYEFVAQDHLEIIERIRQFVVEGRWEPIGGMWIEADCNLTGGESLVRQFTLGQRYFQSQFGQPGSPVLWLPDVFGYAAQLPQLIQQAGLKYFVTAKLSWNQYNRIPYDRFWWRGLDGTQVLTSFITTSKPGWWGATYSADMTPEEIFSTWNNTQQPELHDEILIAFGHGDGGGGMTERMVETAHVMSEIPGAPQVRLTTALDYLERLESQAGAKLPVWSGELYLELHRGTYTSQARNKRANRKMEFLLHDVEFLCAWASLAVGRDYPYDDLERAWKLLCLNQFHDIIPGSSIRDVYVDSARDYAEIEAIGQRLRATALEALDQMLPAEAEIVVYNPTSFTRYEVIEFPAALIPEGQELTSPKDAAYKVTSKRVGSNILAAVDNIPPYGYVTLELVAADDIASLNDSAVFAGIVAEAPADSATLIDTHYVLDNAFLRVELDNKGDIVRLFDKSVGRELLPRGAKANEWQLFEDRPLDWEAWDIDIFYSDTRWEMPPANSIVVVEPGGSRGIIEIQRGFRNSRMSQRLILTETGPRLDFETQIDWQERRTLLKVAFPLALLSSSATYEIQWGNVERPTHQNTSWDWARFESCAHKWVDLSEADYGVSLLNDCKYGYDIHDNVLRMTALKGAMFPDPTADLGEHRFTYSLLPHRGTWREGTARQAYGLNDPLIVRRREIPPGSLTTASRSMISVDVPQIIVETVKLADQGDDVVVRLYESHRTRGTLTLTTGFEISEAWMCDLHETKYQALIPNGNKLTLPFGPYQIMTVRIRPAEPGTRKDTM